MPDQNRHRAERVVLIFYVLRHFVGIAMFLYLILLATQAHDPRFTLLLVALTLAYGSVAGFFIFRAVRRYRTRYNR